MNPLPQIATLHKGIVPVHKSIVAAHFSFGEAQQFNGQTKLIIYSGD